MNYDTVEMHAIVRGRVQGVGFRATVRHHALELGITGTVSNLPDGTVEIYAHGAKNTLEMLLSRLKEDPGLGFVHSIDCTYNTPSQNFEHFQIVHSNLRF